MEVEVQKERLDQWYWAMKYEEKEEVERLKKIVEEQVRFTDPELNKLYELLLVRYHLLHKDYDLSAAAFAELDPTERDGDNHWLNYFYYFFRGIYHYDRKEYQAAIDNYLKAKPLVTQITMIEIAELYYKLASAYHRTYDITLSMEYTHKALKIFKDQAHYRRVASCENLLALNNHDFEQYKEAERHYHEALIFAAKADNELLKMRIFHNFGLLYTDQNDSKTAISYLTKVKKQIENEDDYLKSQNLFLLAKNLFRNDQLEVARDRLGQGKVLSIGLDNEDYYNHCKLLEAKFVNPDHFEKIYIEGITYFRNQELWEYVIEYSEELASYLQGANYYKAACEYYSLAVVGKNKMKKERALSHV
ncbi:MAG TPA: hypothetical protein VF199_04075 [Bacillales bacterium]